MFAIILNKNKQEN